MHRDDHARLRIPGVRAETRSLYTLVLVFGRRRVPLLFFFNKCSHCCLPLLKKNVFFVFMVYVVKP